MKTDKAKQEEIDFPDKLDSKTSKWLKSKPFGDYDRDESRRIFADFSVILFILNKYRPEAKDICELGCGSGWLSIFLSKMGYKVSGYDISPGMIDVAKEKAKKEGVSVLFGVLDIEDEILKEKINSCDAVIIYDALHHCQSDEKVIKKAFAYLRTGGVLILAEPNICHSTDADAIEAREKYSVSERGLSYVNLAKICRNVGFVWVKRYHGSGQSFLPRNEGLIDTIKMLIFPLLTRFYYSKRRTRIWLVAKK